MIFDNYTRCWQAGDAKQMEETNLGQAARDLRKIFVIFRNIDSRRRKQAQSRVKERKHHVVALIFLFGKSLSDLLFSSKTNLHKYELHTLTKILQKI